MPSYTYTITPANWNNVAFWSAINDSSYFQELDFSALGPGYSVDYDLATGIITISDGATTFTVGESGVTGTDANMGAQTLMENFTILRGTQGDDVLDVTGTSWFSTLYGGDGNDTLLGGTGFDSLVGGAGNDYISGGSGDGYFLGGDGDDTILGGDDWETVIGGAGNDSIVGGAGNDSLLGEDGDDWMSGGADIDTLYGGAGSDTMFGDGGDDFLSGDVGDDWMSGGAGDDTLDGGADNDYILGGSGYNILRGGDGIDTLLGGDNWDDIYGGAGNDSMDGGAGEDSLFGEDGDDTLLGGAHSDTLDGGAGNDLIFGGDGSDTLLGAADDDTLAGESGDDTIDGGDGADVLMGGQGNDSIAGGAGGDNIMGDGQWIELAQYGSPPGVTATTLTITNSSDLPIDLYLIEPSEVTTYYATIAPGDTHVQPAFEEQNWLISDDWGYYLQLIEGAPNQVIDYGAEGLDDSIDGGAGDDQIFGMGGNDTLAGGLGSDLMFGGAGDDTFILTSGDSAEGGDGDDVFNVSRDDLTGGTLFVQGSETGETLGDTLNIIGPAEIIYDGGNPENGTVTWLDGTTLTFSEIETVNYVPCFTADTRIKTLRGEVRAADIRKGEMVLTRDAGYQPVRWIGTRTLGATELACQPDLRPVIIRAGALGINQPERDLMVSPQHRMLVGSPQTALWFGEDEVLVAAAHLTCLDRVERADALKGVTYVHLMFDDHQIVSGDGAWSESFQPGNLALSGMDAPQRDELYALFPELRDDRLNTAFPAARVTLKAHEAQILALCPVSAAA